MKGKLKNYKFLGVFRRNELPNLEPGEACIFNNKSVKGEHWLAGICSLKTGKKYVYDSFARSPEHFHLSREWYGTENTAEERIYETNCGQRSVIWLCLADAIGPDKVAKII